MIYKDLDSVLRKYLCGELDEDDRRYLDKWLSESSENRHALKKLEEVWNESSQEPALVNADARIDELWAKGVLSKNKNKKENLTFYLRIAATVCIFIITGLLLYGIYNKTSEKPQGPAEYIVKSNPSGQKTQFHLPDGSVVWLNSASSLKYVKGFKGMERKVVLSGEAYFEVAKNLQKPFIVKTGGFMTTAMGTAFNIRFYPDESNVQISLVEGKVLVNNHFNDLKRSIILTPGKEVFYNKQTKELFERQFNALEVLGWKHGSLLFRKAGFEEVVRGLEKWFGVRIKTTGSPAEEWKLTATYTEQTLINILEDLQYSKDFTYELKENDLIIKFKSL